MADTLPSTIIHLTEDEKVIPIHHENIQYFHDAQGINTIAEVSSSRYANKFKELKTNLGISPNVYWFRIQIQTEASPAESRILELEYPPFEKIAVYIPDGRGGFIEKVSGAGIDFSLREIKVHTHSFYLPTKEGLYTIYIKAESPAMKIPLKIMSESYFSNHIVNSTVFFGVISGIFLLIIFINILMFIKFVNYTNLLYSIYASFLLLTLLSDAGIGFQYLWPENTWWNAKSLSFLTICVGISHVAFAKNLLSIKRYSSFLNKICIAVIIIYSIIGITILFIPNWIAFKTAIIALCLLFFLGIAAILVSYNKGDKAVKYYFWGWISLFLIVGTSFFRYLGSDPILIGINYASSLGSITEIIFFAMAIGVNIKQFIEERTILKQSAKESLSPIQQINLTDREKEVLTFLAEGLTDKEIAEKMFLSLPTIRTYLRSLFKKLGVRNRIEAISKTDVLK